MVVVLLVRDRMLVAVMELVPVAMVVSVLYGVTIVHSHQLAVEICKDE
jgi:hypothetical protein